MWLRWWAALLLVLGLVAPAMAQRGGDDGAYQILSARYGSDRRSAELRRSVSRPLTSIASSSPIRTDPLAIIAPRSSPAMPSTACVPAH